MFRRLSAPGITGEIHWPQIRDVPALFIVAPRQIARGILFNRIKDRAGFASSSADERAIASRCTHAAHVFVLTLSEFGKIVGKAASGKNRRAYIGRDRMIRIALVISFAMLAP